jgi:hypothetical protein
MRTDWSRLGGVPPEALVGARTLAHHAAQWATKAARANLAAVPDDSHASLEWVAGRTALLSRPLPAKGAAMRVGVGLGDLRLLVVRGSAVSDFALDGRSDAEAGAWVDAALEAVGLAPASKVELPYEMPRHAVARGAPYGVRSEAAALQELERWFGAAADVLEEASARLRSVRPGPSPVCCWPHHFDIATLVRLEAGEAESTRSIGVGFSPGDDSYPQPYWYVSPWPKPDPSALPPPSVPGHWHTQGFTGIVATGDDILKLAERRRDTLAFVTQSVALSRALLGA